MVRIIQFIILTLLLLAVTSFANFKLKSFVFSAKNVKINDTIETIICGNSRLAVLNPANVPKAINICNKAENYFYTYHLLADLLKKNQGIKQVLMPCSYDNFSLSQEEQMYVMMNKYLLLIGYKDLFSLGNLNAWKAVFVKTLPFDFENTLSTLLFHRLKQLPQDAVPHFGRYYYSKKCNLDTIIMIESITKGYYGERGEFKTSRLFKKSFLAILDLCEKYKVKLLLINTPYHPHYSSKIPIEAKTDFLSFVHNEVGRRSYIRYMDVSEITLQDSLYGDGHHVNAKGAILLADTICSFGGFKLP